MRCQDPVWDFSPDGKDRFAQPTIREQTFAQPERNRTPGTVTAFKAHTKKHTARKETDPNNIFYSRNGAIWVVVFFINLPEYTPAQIFLLDYDCYQDDMGNNGSQALCLSQRLTEMCFRTRPIFPVSNGPELFHTRSTARAVNIVPIA